MSRQDSRHLKWPSQKCLITPDQRAYRSGHENEAIEECQKRSKYIDVVSAYRG